MMSNFNTFTVYLGSAGKAPQIYKDAASLLGQMIAESDKKLVYGGMDAGLMGILAGAALDHGGHVTGIIPKRLQDSERIHPRIQEQILVQDLWERKKKMFLAADGIISLPGGYGTLDESLEVLYWGALGLHQKPLVLININGFWDPIIEFLKNMPDLDDRFLIVCKGPEDVFDALASWKRPEHKIVKELGDDTALPHFEDMILNGGNDPLIFRKATLENAYFLITALGLKQLNKHQRAIGLLNDSGQFDNLYAWVDIATRDFFITQHCKTMMTVAHDEKTLVEFMARHKHIEIDLHADKWGDATGV